MEGVTFEMICSTVTLDCQVGLIAVGSPLRLPVGTDTMCVVYEIPGASFLSISLLLFVGVTALAPGS